MAQPSVNTANLIGRDRGANAAAAKQNSTFGAAVEDGTGNRRGEIRIIRRIAITSAHVQEFTTPFAQANGEELLQIKTGMIRTDHYFHLFSYFLDCASAVYTRLPRLYPAPDLQMIDRRLRTRQG